MRGRTTRRNFLAAGLGAAAALRSGAQTKTKRLATDWVTLGKSGVQVTRLAFGTGTMGGRVQRDLGQDGFTRLVRYAYDHGVRFFETADTYGGMHEMLGIALKGLPRDSYRLMSKYRTPNFGDPLPRLDLYRKQLNTDYLDIMLLHCVRPATWDTDYRDMQDAFLEAQHRKMILARGASVHGLPALRRFPGNKFLQVAMIRMNHNGVRMDVDSDMEPRSNQIGDVREVVARTRDVHDEGMGVISMKLVGEGRFVTPEDREAALRHTMNLGCVDSVTIGFKNTAEIDEAIERMNRVMNS
ncbi:MAG TPA: aldo/keto reductase [Verrucomicrobiae bacterium]|nr:aldo/keto reductase [Verrucomicrobiae bacterium]